MVVIFKSKLENKLYYGDLMNNPEFIDDNTKHIDVLDPIRLHKNKKNRISDTNRKSSYVQSVLMENVIWIGEGKIEDNYPEHFL